MDKMMDKITDKITDKIVEKVENFVDHHGKLEEDLNELRSEWQVLKRRKIDVNSRIQVEVEVHSGQVVKEEVKGWLEDVQKIEQDIHDVEDRVDRVPYLKRASLDKLVREKIEVVRRIQGRGIFEGGLGIKRAPVCGMVLPTENIEGEISTKDEIRKHLMDDKVGMIGVCGIGGVGKTTIMKHINNDLLREGRFQKVIWVVVSYPLNVFELQKKIVDAMGQTLREDDEERRAVALTEIMGRNRFVLILDDVWEKFSLKDVGIPEPTVQNGCKVVITSRSDEVGNYLRCKIVQVQPLSAEESLNLFLDTVGREVLQKVSRLEETLKLIVQECDGLPLAIIVIAGSMRGIDDIEEWRTMLDDLQQCVESVEGMEDKVFARLKLSYDRLTKPEIQQCFLYCSLFREDYEFSREELIEGWIDEGLIDKSRGRQKAYDRGHHFLNRLERNYLLEKTVNLHDADAFKMHDVVRDMAIRSIGPGVGYMVRSGMKLTEVPNEHDWAKDLKRVSLMANHISKIPVGLTPKCPTLSTLILSVNPLSEISSSFFEDMAGLKVLDLSGTGVQALPDSISNLVNLSALRLRMCRSLKYLPFLAKLRALKKLDLHGAGIEVVPQGMEMLISLEYLDLSGTNIEALPSSISKLEHLSALWLRRCWRLKCLPSLEKFVALKKLDLREAGIEVVPQGMEMLVSLEYLDLSCQNLKEIPTGILSKLSSLQYLVAKGDWPTSVKIKINLEEVARLRKLEILGYNFDDMQDFNYLLREFKNFKSFSAYELLVGKQSYSDNLNSKYKYRLIISECDIGEECTVLPDKLQHLRIHKCKNIKSSLNKTALLENATELGLCIIDECEEIEYVVELNSSSSSSCSPAVLDELEDVYSSSSCSLAVLDKLELLHLWDLPRLWALVRLEGVATPPRVFSSLKKLQISRCSGMRKLLPLKLLQALQNLEYIGVHYCKQMEEIIELSDSDASSSDKFTFTFPKLSELCLQELPQLKSICSAKGVMVCDSIEFILIMDCFELKRIPIQLPLLDNGQPSPPPHLGEICINKWEKESKKWWESVVEWDHPNAKNILQPFLKFL